MLWVWETKKEFSVEAELFAYSTGYVRACGSSWAFAGGFMEDIEEGNATDLEELELNIEEGIDNFLDEIKN